jgi:PAS domain-containing protein
MQALARVRARAARLRGRPLAEIAETAVDALNEALELTDSLREECARLQRRCTELEQRAREQQAASIALLDRLPSALVSTDRAGMIVHANRSAAKLLGRSAPHLRDTLLLHFFEDREAFSSLLQRLPEQREVFARPMRFRPRERAAIDTLVTVIEDPRGSETSWVWCIERTPPRQ